MKCRSGMVEVTTTLDCLIIAGIALILWDRTRSKSSLDNQYHDLTEGLGLMFQDIQQKMQELSNLKDFMPDISLINQNPIASLVELFQAMTGNEGFKAPPRDSSGRFDAEPGELNAPTTQDEDDTKTL